MPGRIDSQQYDVARRHVRGSASHALAITDRVYDAAESIATAKTFHPVNTRGLSKGPIVVIVTLLAKACKTYRAIRATTLEGCGEDAGVLVRVLFETTLAVMWILQSNSKLRGRLFLAHQDQRMLIQIEDMSRTPGLKRAARPSLAKARATVYAYEKYLSRTQIDSVRRHWSGLSGGIEATAKRIPGGRRLYALVYRLASSQAHGADMGSHAIYRDGVGLVLRILPDSQAAEYNLIAAALLLHTLVTRMDKRMGLGRKSELEAIGVELTAWRPIA